MNVQVLDGIIKLLAIIAKIDGVSDEEKLVIKNYLTEVVSDKDVETYVAKFTEYAAKLSGSDEEVTAIASKLNQELSLQQKVIILIRLVEIVYADRVFTEQEEQYMLLITRALNFDEEVYKQIVNFIHHEQIENYSGEEYLLVSGRYTNINGGLKQYHKHGLELDLLVFRLKVVDMYFIRLFNVEADVFMSGEVLREQHIYPLSNGAVIKGEKIDNLYYSEITGNFLNEGRAVKISFEAKDIKYTFGNGKIGLRDVNVLEDSGKLVAIMGGSGAGKSTLLNVLNGNSQPAEGKVMINGIDIYSEKNKIEGVIGYVPQDDLLIEDLTVYQNLFFAGKLCFGDKTDEEIDKLVLKTLMDLGLYEARELKVGNVLQKTISGGQRKRLNIGLELLRQPSVMFVDEPTSGLSSRDSENILDLLRELTLAGKLIFVVIHQPSSEIFKMFDKLVILDTGGYPIYYGDPVQAVIYFKTLDDQIGKDQGECETCGNVNPEQIFNIIEQKVVDEFGLETNTRKTSPDSWYSKFKELIKIPEVTTVSERPLNTLRIPNKLKQWFIFTKRDVLSKFNNKQYLAINLLQAPMLAFMLAFIVRYFKVDDLADEQKGYLFMNNMNIPSYIFISVIIALFMGLTVSAEEIIRDAKILKREAFLNLSRHSYLLSKIYIMFAFSFLQTIMFTLLGNYIIGIRDMNLTYWMVLFSSACFANMLGLNISATFNSAVTIYITIPLLLIPQLVLGGIVVKFEEINPQIGSQDKVPIVGELMASRWAYEGLMVAQFKDNEYEKHFYEANKYIHNADYKKVHLLPALDGKVDDCQQIIINGDTDAMSKRKMNMNLRELNEELGKEAALHPDIPFGDLEKLSPEKYNQQVGEETKKFIHQLEVVYKKQIAFYLDWRNKYEQENFKSDASGGELAKLREDYSNESVTNMVENKTNPASPGTLIESNSHIIRKYRPIYFDPENIKHPLDFRTHFFAPNKHIFGMLIPTVYFNTGVIWFMILVLYVTLYTKAFKKLMRIGS